MRDGTKWYRATVVQKLAVNTYSVRINHLDVICKRHIHQLILARDSDNSQNRHMVTTPSNYSPSSVFNPNQSFTSAAPNEPTLPQSNVPQCSESIISPNQSTGSSNNRSSVAIESNDIVTNRTKAFVKESKTSGSLWF